MGQAQPSWQKGKFNTELDALELYGGSGCTWGFSVLPVAGCRGQAELDLHLARHRSCLNHRAVLDLKSYLKRDKAIKEIEQGSRGDIK